MIERAIDLENGGAMVMRKDSMMIGGLHEQESYAFPSPMTLRFQALYAACHCQRKYLIGSLIVFLLVIAGIVSALVIVASKGSIPENSLSTTSILSTSSMLSTSSVSSTSSMSSTSSTSTPEPGPKIYSKTYYEYLSQSYSNGVSMNVKTSNLKPFSAKLLVAAGRLAANDGDMVMNSEVVDLHDPDVTCQPWHDHPVGTLGASGGLINDQLIICSGFDNHEGTSLCHSLTPTTIENIYNLSFPSANSASVILGQDTLLISGGYDINVIDVIKAILNCAHQKVHVILYVF